jgi:hypothetical protein
MPTATAEMTPDVRCRFLPTPTLPANLVVDTMLSTVFKGKEVLATFSYATCLHSIRGPGRGNPTAFIMVYIIVLIACPRMEMNAQLRGRVVVEKVT